jgi:hypothetical protein
MSRALYPVLGLILVITAACGTTDRQEAGNLPAETQTAPEITAPSEEMAPQPSLPATQTPETPRPPAAAKSTPKLKAAPPPAPPPPPAAPAPAAAAPTPEPVVAPPPPPEPQYASLTGGTIIPVRLLDPLDSGVNQIGDTFRAMVDQDLIIDGKTVVPSGSIVEGELTYVEKSGRVKGRAAMSMQLISLKIGRERYPIGTEVLSFEAEATKKKDATKVGIGTGLGAVIGAIAGGGKGAAIGAAAGAGAGTATVLATRGDEVKFEAEHPFDFTLSQDVGIRIQ